MPTREELKPHQQAYKVFLGQTEALRPDLYRYCRHLCASVFDAEDLVQETLLRCYAKLGETYYEIADWRAYLFRTASNLWLNEQRRAGRLIYSDQPPELDAPDTSRELAGDVRQALLTLVEQLAPQERVALVLKEVFALPLSEIATQLETSVGAVKHALHRAREKLDAAQRRPEPARNARPATPCPKVLEDFVAAFNSHNIDRVVAILREDATARVMGLVQENNREDIRRGSLPHTISDTIFAEVATFNGEWLVVLGPRAPGSEKLAKGGEFMRIRTAGDKVVRIDNYFFTLDLLNEVLPQMGYEADLCGCYFFK